MADIILMWIGLLLILRTDAIMDKLEVPRMMIDRRWRLRRMTKREWEADYRIKS